MKYELESTIVMVKCMPTQYGGEPSVGDKMAIVAFDKTSKDYLCSFLNNDEYNGWLGIDMEDSYTGKRFKRIKDILKYTNRFWWVTEQEMDTCFRVIIDEEVEL